MAIKLIDVSHHNGRIDWEKVAADGVKMAIIHAGYGREINQKDATFEYNYREARRNGIKVGAYWYSYATDAEGGRKEARTFLKVIDGKKFDLPLWFDQEYEKKILLLNDKTRTDIVLAFIQIVKLAGYDCGLYCSRSWLDYQLSYSRLSGVRLWLAEYAKKLGGHYKPDIWQYSSKGKVNGIKGNVDMNHCYTDFGNTFAPVTGVKDKRVEFADFRDVLLSGTYQTTADLNLRFGAGTDKDIITVMKKGSKVQCYGFYSTVKGVNWLLVGYNDGGSTRTGFCSAKYLKKC